MKNIIIDLKVKILIGILVVVGGIVLIVLLNKCVEKPPVTTTTTISGKEISKQEALEIANQLLQSECERNFTKVDEVKKVDWNSYQGMTLKGVCPEIENYTEKKIWRIRGRVKNLPKSFEEKLYLYIVGLVGIHGKFVCLFGRDLHKIRSLEEICKPPKITKSWSLDDLPFLDKEDITEQLRNDLKSLPFDISKTLENATRIRYGVLNKDEKLEGVEIIISKFNSTSSALNLWNFVKSQRRYSKRCKISGINGLCEKIKWYGGGLTFTFAWWVGRYINSVTASSNNKSEEFLRLSLEPFVNLTQDRLLEY